MLFIRLSGVQNVFCRRRFAEHRQSYTSPTSARKSLKGFFICPLEIACKARH